MGDQLHPGAPPTYPTPPSAAAGGGGGGFIFPQAIPTAPMPYNHHPPVFHQELNSHPSKRPRYSSMDDQRRLMHNNGNRSMNTRMFFKTRLCDKFIAGENCPYGTKCTYAHGPEELRAAAYDERQGRGQIGGLIDQRNRSNVNKVCRKFFGGEECPYGDGCIFLHKRPEGLKESLAIRVPIISNGGVEAAGDREVVGDHMWKTRMCIKWESTGACPYGEGCHFAHGYTELRKLGGGNMESGRMNVIAAPCKPPPVSCADEIPKEPEPAPRKNYLKWTDPKKIGRIYGDWI